MKNIKNILKFNFLLRIFVLYFLFTSESLAEKNSFFSEGKDFFEKKQYKKAQILFERDIVFNPKNEDSYLYLAKIFNKDENGEESEINLRNVLLINPQNDEALYLLTLLKIQQSNYEEAKELMDKFNIVCKSFCPKKSEMNEKFEKIVPENEKN